MGYPVRIREEVKRDRQQSVKVMVRPVTEYLKPAGRPNGPMPGNAAARGHTRPAR